MNGLMSCGICCMLVSGWGIVQLFIIGFLCYFETPVYFEECEAHEYADYDDFINKTKSNFRKVAFNCWIAAGMYLVTLLLSYLCIKKAKSDAARRAMLEEDDEYVCNPPPSNNKKENKEK